MLTLPKIGNLKLGATDKGLPVQYSSLYPTLNYKNDENFVAHPEFKESDSFRVLLPLGTKSIDISFMSFIKINNIKYLAREDDGIVYAFPLQPNFQNPGIDYPVIKLGPIKNYFDSLELKKRAFVQLRILTKYSSYNPFSMMTLKEPTNSGVFHFKSESAFTFMDLENAVQITKEMISNICPNVKDPEAFPFITTFEVHNKLYNLGKKNTVTYARLLPPSMEDFVELDEMVNFSNENSITLKYAESTSKILLDSKEKAIKEAITLDNPDKYKTWFTEKIAITLDKDEDFKEFLGSKVSKNSTLEEMSPEDTSKAELYSKETKIPLAICKRAIVVVGNEEALKLINKHKTVPAILEAIKIEEDKKC